jgi:uncharacterized protein YdeI (YjbR/CyaY-like superfamily)
MQMNELLYLSTRTEWRAWLKKHHSNTQVVWLVYYKKGSGRDRSVSRTSVGHGKLQPHGVIKSP